MATIDVEKLLQPLSDDSPSGENLEYDPDFGELERAAVGQAERVMGDERIEAEEPHWDEVFEKAEALFGRTRDLRVAIYLARGGLKTGGFATFADGMRVLAGLITNFWDDVYPELDADDDNDPTLRINSLLELNSRDGMLRDLERTPLVESRAVGRFGLRDVLIATGERSPSGDEAAPDGALIDAAFMDVDLDEMTATAAAIRDSADSLTELQEFIVDKVGTQFAPDLEPFARELAALRKVITSKLEMRGVADPAADDGSEGADSAGEAGAMNVSGEIRSREDAIRLIEKAAEYFRRNEPSSPVPLLLDRAKRLISKDFLDILRDMAPDGLSSAKNIGGVAGDDD